jgi:hypothetical protein
MNLPIYLLEINEDLTDGSEVDFVALVDKPAIERNFLRFKEDRLSFEIQDEERRIISGPIMLADTPIYRNDNGQEYFVSFPKDTIYKIVKKMFQKNYTGNVNLMHDPKKIVEGVTMFECWISDESRGVKPMKGFEDAPDGSAFASYFVDNEDVWQKVKSGEFKGFSVEGLFNYKRGEQVMNYEEKLWSDIANILNECNFKG